VVSYVLLQRNYLQDFVPVCSVLQSKLNNNFEYIRGLQIFDLIRSIAEIEQERIPFVKGVAVSALKIKVTEANKFELTFKL
jgi:hypothetical protein